MRAKDTRRMLAIKMPQETYRSLSSRSEELGYTMQALIRVLVENWLESELTANTAVSAKMKEPLEG